MSSIEVKLGATNPSKMHINKGVRFTKISARGKQFESPYRIVNRNDLNAKSGIPTVESVFDQSPIFLYEESFNAHKINEFVSDSSVSSRLIDNMKNSFSHSQHAALNLFLPAWARKDSEVNEIYSSQRLRENFIYTSLRIQELLDLPLKSIPIVIPYEAGPYIDLDYVKKAIKKSGCSDEQLALVVDMKIKNIDTMRKILNEFTSGENNLSPFILFRHQPEEKAIQIYRLINELQNEEKTSYLFVDIEDRATSDSLSIAHLSELQWGEGFSQRFKPGFQTKTKEGSEKKELDPLELSFFRPDLGVVKFREMLGNDEILEKIQDTYFIDSLVDKLNTQDITNDLAKAASAYTRIHELFLSSKELKDSRSFLGSSTVDEYISEKWRLKNHFPPEAKPLF